MEKRPAQQNSGKAIQDSSSWLKKSLDKPSAKINTNPPSKKK